VKKQTKWLLGGILLVLLGGWGLAQIFTFTRPIYDNPPVEQEPNWDSPETRALAKRACFDCHSNETVWPWYSYVFPMSEMIQQDVKKGREVLNFSEWAADQAETVDTETIVESISTDQMPLPYYLILHPEAQLTDTEQGQLINGLIATTSPADESLEADELDKDEE
jgi:hypothetical protein